MKKKFMYRVLGCVLSALIATGSLSIGVLAKQSISGNELAEAAVLAETAVLEEESPQELEYPLMSDLNLFKLNWKNETDEVISHYVGMNEWDVIGEWLSSMSEEDRKELLSRDTVLIQETIIEDPQQEEPIEALYYEYALKQYEERMGACSEIRAERAGYPAKTSGYWQTHIVQKNMMGTTVRTAIITYKISGVDTMLPTTKRQSVTVAKSINSNWCGVAWETEKEEFSTYKEMENNTTYPLVKAYMNFQKPAGYKVSVSYNQNAGFRKLYWSPSTTFGASDSLFISGGLISDNRKEYPGVVTYNGKSTASLVESRYAGKHYVCSIVNMFMNAGIGTTATPANGNVVQTITLTPINYNVSYNGNGATAGSVSAQMCTYDVNYPVQSNGFSKDYTVTYNGNGGTPAVSSQVASYTFKGWGLNQKDTVTYAAGKNYTNLTTVDGGTATLYALWNPASVKLPGAERTGYRLDGWNIGKEGESYVPTANITATAKWLANIYTVQFQSAGGQACEPIAAEYDQNIMLPTPFRAGYTFNGWVGELGTYVGSAKNLSKEHGAIVTLTADWTADTNTPYKVQYYKQPSPEVKDTEQYVLFELNQGDPMDGEMTMYGTTDETVTIPPEDIEGYITPATQSVQISGDGSTVIRFYYHIKTEEKPEASTKPQEGITNDAQIDEIAKRIAAGLSFSLDINGAEYEIAQNADGTLGIRFLATNETKVVIPDVVKVGDKVYRITEIYEKAFKDNTSIKELELSANISKIGDSAFEGCTSLEKMTVREGLVTIGNKAFSGCSRLKSVKMPSTLQTIGNYAFQNCSALSKVTLNTGLVKIGKKAFYNCASLTQITVPKTVLKIDSYAFAKCKKLKKVSFASGSSLLSLGTGVFSNCASLTKIKMPSKLTNLPAKAFYNCKKLKSVTGGSAVTKIGNEAFRNCVKISKMTIPAKVQTIGKKAFYNCKALKKVTVKTKALTSVSSQAFKKCNKKLQFVVPKSKKSAYSKMFQGKY